MHRYNYRSYDEYLEQQVDAYHRKLYTHQCALEENIQILSDYLAGRRGSEVKGLCHGVRSGLEVGWFEKHLPGALVLGTDIGSAAGDKVIQWDFNKENKKWVGYFDFVYSNSFDHAYDPQQTLNIWLEQLKPDGLLLIEHNGRDEGANRTDCTGMNMVDWLSFARVVDILFLDATQRQRYKIVMVIEK